MRFYSEVSMGDGSWYANKFLVGAEKRGGFIEIYGSDWNTIARVADLDELLTWDEIQILQSGLKQAWVDVVEYLPSALKNKEQLKFSTDDNNIYAFTAAGVMVAQINYWNDEHTWDGWFDGKILPIKNVNYNYNFHDADWSHLAGAGGYDRYIIDGDDRIHEETGSNIGVKIYKSNVDEVLWNTYDPKDTTGTIIWDNVSEIWVQSETRQGIANEYRRDDWVRTDASERIGFMLMSKARMETICWISGRTRWVS